jgi:hypothetical protein
LHSHYLLLNAHFLHLTASNQYPEVYLIVTMKTLHSMHAMRLLAYLAQFDMLSPLATVWQYLLVDANIMRMSSKSQETADPT